MNTQNKTTIKQLVGAALVTILSIGFNAQVSQAQFSQAVVVLKGTVRTEAGKPVSVNVSIRSANDTAMEITASRSNSSTGSYLVILKPAHKYWVHLEGSEIMSKDTLIETAAASQTAQVSQDFTVTTHEVETAVGGSAQPSATIQTVIDQKHD